MVGPVSFQDASSSTSGGTSCQSTHRQYSPVGYSSGRIGRDNADRIRSRCSSVASRSIPREGPVVLDKKRADTGRRLRCDTFRTWHAYPDWSRRTVHVSIRITFRRHFRQSLVVPPLTNLPLAFQRLIPYRVHNHNRVPIHSIRLN